MKRSTTVHTLLTRLNVIRLVAVACISALGLLPAGPAHAATTSQQIAVTTREIEATAQRWFTAQADAAHIDASIADVENRISVAENSIAQVRKIATARAVMIYKNGDVGLTSLFGDTALDSARRAQFVDDANAGGDAAIAQLTAGVDTLKSEQHSLEAARAQQQKTLHEVSTERVTLDAELTVIRTRARHDANVAFATAHNRTARARAAVHVRALAAVPSANTLAAPTAPASSTDIGGIAVAAAPPTRLRSEPAPRRPLPRVHACSRERRQLRRRQPVRLLRRVSIPPVDMGHLGGARRPDRPRGSAPVARVRGPTRTTSRGRCTNGRAPGPGAGAANSLHCRIPRSIRAIRAPRAGWRPASDAKRRSAPERSSCSVISCGTAMQYSPAAFAAATPCGESSIAIAAAGSTPSAAHAAR